MYFQDDVNYEINSSSLLANKADDMDHILWLSKLWTLNAALPQMQHTKAAHIHVHMHTWKCTPRIGVCPLI